MQLPENLKVLNDEDAAKITGGSRAEDWGEWVGERVEDFLGGIWDFGKGIVKAFTNGK